MKIAAKNNAWSEADALFAAALEIDASARAAFLQRECRKRPALRREVEELLAATEAAEACFAGVPAAIGATLEDCISDRVGAPTTEGHADEPAGSTIGRYRVVRRLARGGMGTVYLAERADGAFQRRAALKLLRRGLDTDDILDRFRAERQILADLEHRNIARLLDGGSTADGRPYLVMEYVDGLPITDYCNTHELDLKARLELFLEVCDAVHHAHGHGVIHRDLKPANIFVDRSGHVKLLDFGIARLLDPEVHPAHTRPGLRLLTPDYASPEQVCGGSIEVKSDVYQLGLLLYELLSLTRPYCVSSRSVTELERVICSEPVAAPSTRVARPDRRRLRGNLDSIALKALQKDPARRYESAAALALDVRDHLDGRSVAARSGARAYRLRLLGRRYGAKLGLAVAAGVTLYSAVLVSGPDSRTVGVRDPASVAVLPFRVSGADPSLSYLREGLVDLLSTKLTGEGGPRAIPPASVLDAWREASGSLARDMDEGQVMGLAGDIGASELLVGEVVGTSSRVILNASILRVPTGDIAARATVQGPADSLLSIVDRLTAELLIDGAGERHSSLGALATFSLPALRAYLDGRVAFRAAKYEDAYLRFSEAVELDSTFALAAMRAWQAAWFSKRTGSERLLDVAWRGRHRLDAFDQALLDAVLGSNHPGPTSETEKLAARRRLVDTSPHRGEFRYMLADRMYHWHAILELPDGRERAAAQFRRALTADSSYAPTYEHLVPLLYSLGHEAEAHRVAHAYFNRVMGSASASFLAWYLAAAEGDSVTLRKVRARFGELGNGELMRIFSTAVHQGIEVEDAERALEVLRHRGLAPALRQRVLREYFILQNLRGRPGSAVEVAEMLRESHLAEEDLPRLEASNSLVLSALYGGGDRTVAEYHVEKLTRSAFGPGEVPKEDARVPDLCTLAQWRLWNGETRGVDLVVERLRREDRQSRLKDTGPVCAQLLEAIDATLRGRSDAPDLVARLDSTLATGPHVLFTMLEVQANLAASRLNEQLGAPERALAAVRRRVYDHDSSSLLLATSLRTEGRLAAQVGDTEGAIRAYRHYLALRSDPEAVLRPQADSVRSELAELTARF